MWLLAPATVESSLGGAEYTKAAVAVCTLITTGITAWDTTFTAALLFFAGLAEILATSVAEEHGLEPYTGGTKYTKPDVAVFTLINKMTGIAALDITFTTELVLFAGLAEVSAASVTEEEHGLAPCTYLFATISTSDVSPALVVKEFLAFLAPEDIPPSPF